MLDLVRVVTLVGIAATLAYLPVASILWFREGIPRTVRLIFTSDLRGERSAKLIVAMRVLLPLIATVWVIELVLMLFLRAI